MTNKHIKRIFSKTLNIRSREEFETLFASFAQKDEALEMIDALDKAVADLERMIDLRDRSLSLSSKELVSLNETVSAQAREQGEVLDQLRATVSLLRDDRGGLGQKTD